jgi:hypothetical protein
VLLLITLHYTPHSGEEEKDVLPKVMKRLFRTLLSPRKVFLNLDSLSPVAAAMYRSAHHMRDQLTALDFSSRLWQANLQELQKSISEMHEHIALTTSQIASLRKDRRACKHSVIIANFTPGQFVLRANVRTVAPGNKLSARWEGPYRVIRAINSSVYVIQDLLDDSLHEVHTCRLKPYWEADLRVTVELRDQVSIHLVEMLVMIRFLLIVSIANCLVGNSILNG